VDYTIGNILLLLYRSINPNNLAGTYPSFFI